ncbi:hypothetical protein ES708_04675 [subsurface metagenome]
MAKTKKIRNKPRAPGLNKNPYLNFNGGINLIERFPKYKDRKKRKKRGERKQ